MAYTVFIFFFVQLMSMVPHLALCSHEFHVGGDRGWAKPTGNDSETYNDWASHNRFHIGDTLYFEYHDDSVLVVNQEDYGNCITTNPISKFEDEKTVFELERSGFFYFISGEPRHCKLGQRLVIRVMVAPEVEPPENAPPPKAGHHGWDAFNFGPPEFNSTTKLSVASYFMTALVSVFIVFYQFM